jgi:hypothetical protein
MDSFEQLAIAAELLTAEMQCLHMGLSAQQAAWLLLVRQLVQGKQLDQPALVRNLQGMAGLNPDESYQAHLQLLAGALALRPS